MSTPALLDSIEVSMKRHCCNDERRCYALDCDSEEADCECGCNRCAAITECAFRPCNARADTDGLCRVHHELLTNTAGT